MQTRRTRGQAEKEPPAKGRTAAKKKVHKKTPREQALEKKVAEVEKQLEKTRALLEKKEKECEILLEQLQDKKPAANAGQGRCEKIDDLKDGECGIPCCGTNCRKCKAFMEETLKGKKIEHIENGKILKRPMKLTDIRWSDDSRKLVDLQWEVDSVPGSFKHISAYMEMEKHVKACAGYNPPLFGKGTLRQTLGKTLRET